MLLALDVGNTKIPIGGFDGETSLRTLRITTKVPRTADESAIWIK